MDNEKLRILNLLIENKEKKYSIRQISLERKINYKSAYQAINKLSEEGVLQLEIKGNITLCSFNNKFNQSVFIVEEYRREQLIKDKKFRAVYNGLRHVNEFLIAVLFGSHAKGNADKNSDIDLLVVTEDVSTIREELSILPFKIHITDVNMKDFIMMLMTKEATVVSEALKKNVILVGIEDFYRVMNNAIG
jgi:Fe2+ or Zn2+ uptake regulation protein